MSDPFDFDAADEHDAAGPTRAGSRGAAPRSPRRKQLLGGGRSGFSSPTPASPAPGAAAAAARGASPRRPHGRAAGYGGAGAGAGAGRGGQKGGGGGSRAGGRRRIRFGGDDGGHPNESGSAAQMELEQEQYDDMEFDGEFSGHHHNRNDNDQLDDDGVNSIATTSTTTSTSTSPRRRNKKKKSKSASAMLQKRLAQVEKEEQEREREAAKREQEQMEEAKMSHFLSAGRKKKARAGGGSSSSTSVGGRRRKKTGNVGSASRSVSRSASSSNAGSSNGGGGSRGHRVVPVQTLRRPGQTASKARKKVTGSGSIGSKSMEDEYNDEQYRYGMNDDGLSRDERSGRRRVRGDDKEGGDDGSTSILHDEEECNSRAGTPRMIGGSKRSRRTHSPDEVGDDNNDGGIDEDHMIPTTLHSVSNEEEPSQSSFLSLSASPYKSSQNSPHPRGADAVANDDDEYQGDDKEMASHASSSFGSRSHSTANSRRRKRIVRRAGYGSQSSSVASASSLGGISAGASTGAVDSVDDYGSISTVESDVVKGAGIDRFATQDAGTYRMLSEECSYLCDTVISARRDPDDNDDDNDSDDGCIADPIVRHTSVTAGAACELAALFSSSRNRAVLLRTARILGSNRNADNSEDRDALDAILDAIGCAPVPNGTSCGDGMATASASTGRMSKGRRKRTAAAVGEAGTEKEASTATMDGPNIKYDRVASHALSLLSYYLSLECARGNRSALREIPAAARRVRKRVLRHRHALRGVARMVQLDPVVDSILGDELPSAGASETPVSKEMEIKERISQSGGEKESLVRAGVKRSRDVEEESFNIDAGAEKKSHRDPTKAGRRKRRSKKRKVGLGRSNTELETIPEDNGDDITARESVEAANIPPNIGEETGQSAPSESGNRDDLPQCSPANSVPSVEKSNGRFDGADAHLDFVSSNEKSSSVNGSRVGVSKVVSSLVGLPGADAHIARLNKKIEIGIAKLTKKAMRKPSDCSGVSPCSNSKCPCHQYCGSEFATKSSGYLALGSLNRFLSGKDVDGASHTGGGNADSDKNNSDEDHHAEESDDDISVEYHDGDEQEENNLSNPLFFTNVMLRRSGSLPNIAKAASDTFASIERLVNDGATNHRDARSGPSCTALIGYLRGRVSCLFSVIDGASCLSDKNRALFCSGSSEYRSVLIRSLLQLITAIPFELEMSSVAVSDILLSTLRTLTSLTHENPTAAGHMLSTHGVKWQCESIESGFPSVGKFVGCNHSDPSATPLNGVSIIFHILYRMVNAQEGLRNSLSTNSSQEEEVAGRETRSDDDSRDKHCFDVVVFCLNTLTNIIEHPSVCQEARRQIFSIELPNNDRDESDSPSLSWLASWLTDQTASYRVALMNGSFGQGSPNRRNGDESATRDLENHEQGPLLTAGNGFVLLACLMKAVGDEADASRDDLTLSIRRIILAEMPTDDAGNHVGMTLIIKVLMAFCNFYRFSMGDVSVAIIIPVLKLIKDIQSISQ